MIEREPISVEYRGHEFRSNPPPSSGGVLLALGLQALGEREPTPGAIAERWRRRRRCATPRSRGRSHTRRLLQRLLKGTTHISVLDADGNAASLSASLGSGSGVVVPGTGIHLNNMLGELDLVGASKPGERLTSMMSPSIVLDRGAAAARARERRQRAPARRDPAGDGERRRGGDAGRAGGRGAAHPCGGRRRPLRSGAAADALESEGRTVVRWKERNLFFGGVSAVEVRTDGTTAAAGDPAPRRRGLVVA